MHSSGDISFSDPSRFHLATGVREHEGRVWFGSLENAAVAYVDL